jgi:hypothetical protein
VRRAALAFVVAIGASRAAAQEPRLELSFNAGNANPPFVFQGVEARRSPPPFFESADAQDLWLSSIDVRAYWRKRLSLLGQVTVGNDPIGRFSFFQPSLTGFDSGFDVSESVEHRVWTMSLLQSVDVVDRGRIRPWLAGGISFLHVIDRQQMTFVSRANPPNQSVSATDIDRSTGALVFAVGVKIYVTRRLFISGDESFRGYLSDTPLGTFNAMWRAGIGFGF